MPTSFPMADPWSDNVLQNAAALYANTTVPINDLAATIGTWQSWTPSTVAHFVVGNGTLTCRYILMSKSLLVSVFFQAGSTTTYDSGGAMAFTLPAGLVGAARNQTGRLFVHTSAPQDLLGNVVLNSGASSISLQIPTSSTNSALVSMNSASVNTGTTGNFVVSGTFETA